MIQIQEELDGFINVIRGCEVAKRYDEVCQKVLRDPLLAEQLDRFRRENFRMQVQSPPDQLMEATERFTAEHEKFRENPLVQEFLEAELAYCRMLQEITAQILGVIPLELVEKGSWL